MDALTHALASFSLTRAAFPRCPARLQVAIVVAGTLVDLDTLSYYSGPASYLRFHRSYAHSLPAALLVAALCTAIVGLAFRGSPSRPPLALAFFATLAAAVLHLTLDLCQAQPVEILWPVSNRRIQLDLLARFDLWILILLLAGALLPQLAGLVAQEIGARSRSPRGRLGALLAFSAILLYLTARAGLHTEARQLLDSRAYRGESPQHLAALPDSVSPFLWHGLVETTSALHALDLRLGALTHFDPESATTVYKPEPSAPLQAALTTGSARLLLSLARFPKAVVEKSEGGFHIELRDFAHVSGADSSSFPEALIDTDPSSRVLADRLSWPTNSR
jgi:membrane-bound metal-dependent hydrolase YbcI (DUF457 family)